MIDICKRDAGLLEAIGDGLMGKAGIMLFSSKALLLGCRDDPSVIDEGGGTVVIEGRNTKNVHETLLVVRFDHKNP